MRCRSGVAVSRLNQHVLARDAGELRHGERQVIVVHDHDGALWRDERSPRGRASPEIERVILQYCACPWIGSAVPSPPARTSPGVGAVPRVAKSQHRADPGAAPIHACRAGCWCDLPSALEIRPSVEPSGPTYGNPDGAAGCRGSASTRDSCTHRFAREWFRHAREEDHAACPTGRQASRHRRAGEFVREEIEHVRGGSTAHAQRSRRSRSASRRRAAPA